MINIKEDERLSKLNHSCAHLMAQAVKHLFPNAKFWVGPVIEEGFYYDIDLGDKVITEEDIPLIEKEMNYVGYKILLDGLYYYIMGDTDRTEEADQVKCDVCFVPIGGTYTMDVQEAADYINYIKPTTVIPIHYGSIVGDMQLGNDFSKLIEKNIKVLLLMKER